MAAGSQSSVPDARIKEVRPDGSRTGRIYSDQPPPASRYGSLHSGAQVAPAPFPGPPDPGDDFDRRGPGRGGADRGGLGRGGSKHGGSAHRGLGPARYNPDVPEPHDSRKGRGHRKNDPGDGGGSSDDGSSDSEPEGDDAQKRHDRKIDMKRRDEFTITSESIWKARNYKKRINMR